MAENTRSGLSTQPRAPHGMPPRSCRHRGRSYSWGLRGTGAGVPEAGCVMLSLARQGRGALLHDCGCRVLETGCGPLKVFLGAWQPPSHSCPPVPGSWRRRSKAIRGLELWSDGPSGPGGLVTPTATTDPRAVGSLCPTSPRGRADSPWAFVCPCPFARHSAVLRKAPRDQAPPLGRPAQGGSSLQSSPCERGRGRTPQARPPGPMGGRKGAAPGRWPPCHSDNPQGPHLTLGPASQGASSTPRLSLQRRCFLTDTECNSR